MNISLKNLFSKSRAPARPALHPERAWKILLFSASALFILLALRGVFAYMSVQADETPVPAGAEKVLSKDEFAPAFARYGEKQKRFDELLAVPLQLADPAR